MFCLRVCIILCLLLAGEFKVINKTITQALKELDSQISKSTESTQGLYKPLSILIAYHYIV